MKAIVGRVASTMPRQPPSCSSTRWRSNPRGAPDCAPSPSGAVDADPSARSPGALIAASPVTSVAGASPRALSTSSEGSARAELVPGVVDDPLAVEGGEPATGGQRAAGLDAGDPAAAEPDQGDRPGAVEELGLQGGDGLARGVDHRLQPAGHGHQGSLATGHQRLAAGTGRLRAELLRVDRLVVRGQPLQGARQPAGRSGLRHVLSSLALVGDVPTCSASGMTSQSSVTDPQGTAPTAPGAAGPRRSWALLPTVSRRAAWPAAGQGSGQRPPAAGPAAQPPAGAASAAAARGRAWARYRGRRRGRGPRPPGGPRPPDCRPPSR